jgi:anthranilate synthase component 2
VRVLLVDAYDSFTHIIDQYLRGLGADTRVIRSRTLTPEGMTALGPEAVVLGPGPGHPADSGHVELVRAFARHGTPLLGVCLGHQAIGLAYGGRVNVSGRVMHGKTSRVLHDGEGVFAGVGSPMTATRYHSLAVEVPSDGALRVTARAFEDGCVMGVRHSRLPLEGVQFHPESVTTVGGSHLFANFLDGARDTARQFMRNG